MQGYWYYNFGLEVLYVRKDIQAAFFLIVSSGVTFQVDIDASYYRTLTDSTGTRMSPNSGLWKT